jgi:hypothetical protein
MVTTPAGNVIIDASIAFNAALHTKLLRAVSDAHAHGDHTGGVETRRKFGGPDTQIIVQRNHVEVTWAGSILIRPRCTKPRRGRCIRMW